MQTAKVSGCDSWPIEEHIGAGVLAQDGVLGDGEHATGAAAGIVDGADDVGLGEGGLILGQQEADHQADHLARGKVLAGIFVQRLVETADQLLEDVAHLQVGDLIGVQIDLPELLQHQEEEAGAIELGDCVIEVELLQHLTHIGAEAIDVIAQVGGQVWGVLEQALEVVEGGVVEGEAGGPAELGIEVCQLALEVAVGIEDLLLGGLQHAVDAAQHGKGQDHILVLAAFEGIPQQVGDVPEEGDVFAVVIGVLVVRRYDCRA